MKLSWDIIQSNAIAFSKRWQGITSEKQQDQGFIEGLLRVFGVDDPRAVGTFQEKTKIEGSTKWIDYLWKGKIAVEMKSKGENLDAAFEQLRQYMYSLAEEDVPGLWLVSDFENIRLSRRSTNEIWNFRTKDLRRHIKRFADIAGYETQRDKGEQIEVNVKAAEKMAKLYDALKSHGYEGHELEVYLVRLLFCAFADDTGIFPKDHLYNYIEQSKPDGSDLSYRISDLFEVLNMTPEIREKKTLLSDELKQFRYINGKLFALRLPPADFNAEMRQTLIECLDFDWNKISPAIFGAMFQGVMDKAKRRELGAHYTSEENIEKLINPLFLDDLWKEFDKVKTDPAALDRFHDKIARLKFLDPACGCGNFLVVTYGKLRELELEILKMKCSSNQLVMDISSMLKVSVEQFYGIEYEEFPCQIAQVGMWLIDHQMNLRVSEQFGKYYARLPLTQGATIVHGNALRLDWNAVCDRGELSVVSYQLSEEEGRSSASVQSHPPSADNCKQTTVNYIMGNPPFVGQAFRTKDQSEDVKHVFADNKNAMKLDYVTAWFKKAADMMLNTSIQTAFVSVNSVCQGESVPTLWEHLFSQGVQINFAYQTFKWTNEAKGKAAVMCVIVGFAMPQVKREKRLYADDKYIVVPNINGYLHNAPNVFIQTRSKSINKSVAKVFQGSPPADNGDLQLNKDEMNEFVRKHPESKDYIKPFLGSKEFINDVGEHTRYCFWLKGVSPNRFNKIPELRERFQRISEYRAASPVDRIQKTADRPYLFTQDRQPDTDFIAIPRVSSERRKYIPMGFLSKDIIVSDAMVIVDSATLYEFSLLTSNVHNAWMRTVCGRLKSDFRYAPSVFYNFPMPESTDAQKQQLSELAQAVLDTRGNYPESSLADLYDPLYMPPDLLKAHQNLDKAVWKLYGFTPKTHPSEAAVVAALMEMYQKLTQ